WRFPENHLPGVVPKDRPIRAREPGERRVDRLARILLLCRIGRDLGRKDAIHSTPQVEGLVSRDLFCRLDGGAIVDVKLVKDEGGFPVTVEYPNLIVLHCV